jgi:hypothetical protein
LAVVDAAFRTRDEELLAESVTDREASKGLVSAGEAEVVIGREHKRLNAVLLYWED